MVNWKTFAAVLSTLHHQLQAVEPGTILFDSWGGRLSDSPLAIFNELVSTPRVGQSYVWVRHKGTSPVPGAETVAPNSRQHIAALARAECIVANGHLPRFFRKKRNQFVVQTWHGTPLKKIGYDLLTTGRKKEYGPYLSHLARDVAKWDILLSPSAYATGIFRQAFRFDGPVLESGTPGNDVLKRHSAADVSIKRRAELKIGSQTRLVLVAPTFRDQGPNNESKLLAEVLLTARSVSSNVAFLIRMHNNSRAFLQKAGLPKNVIDVSSWDDISELMILADVLVTDYSSVMFDFAATGKPMIFLCPDLEEYRDSVRGFYLPFPEAAPGPLVRDSQGLTEAIEDAVSGDGFQTFGAAQFRDTYASLEDGFATQRVCQAVWDNPTDRRGLGHVQRLGVDTGQEAES